MNAAVAGVSRVQLKACRVWKSNAVDIYIRVERPGITFNNRMLEKL